jgi:hypothetical protein
MHPDTTPTPRTDEQIWTTFHHHENCDVVDMIFARQLERELTEKTNEVEMLREALDTLTAVVGLTPVLGNKEALQEAFDHARKAIKGHPDDPHCPLQEPVDYWKCPHCGSTTGTWFSRVEPMGDICEDCGKSVDEEPVVVNLEPSNPFVAQKVDNLSDNEWRELGEDEVICEGDEVKFKDNRWTRAQSSLGYKIGYWDGLMQGRTRRPFPVQNEWRELGPDEVIGAADEYNPASLGEWIKVPHGWIGEKCDITKIRTRRPLPKQEDEYHNHPHALMRLQEGINKDISGELQKLRNEIQKLKQK